MSSLPRHRFAAVMATLLIALGLLASSASATEPQRPRAGLGDVRAVDGSSELTVMTQNLYLGSSLAPALEAATPEEFIEAVARIYATVQYTNFPARAEAIADEVQAKEPDLIGLQEVTKWTTEGLNPPPGYDFLAILEGDLEARGLHYSVAAVAHNAHIGPAPLVVSEEICPVLEGPKFSCGVTLEDRDVILVNDDTPGLAWSNPQSGHYAAQLVLESPVGPLSFDRGWASIDATLDGQPFRFVNTHLEVEEAQFYQESQAAEFLAGPGFGGTIVATGDFNSAADGSTTLSYSLLTMPGQFRDSWDEGQLGAGHSCCQESNTPPLAPGALNNPVSSLATRIDLILTRGAASPSGEAELIGDTPFQAEPPFWPSDHAGVVAGIRLPAPPAPAPPAPVPPVSESPPAAVTTDTHVVGGRVKAAPKQWQSRGKILLKVRLKAGEAARGTAFGKVQIGKRGYPLKTVSQSLVAGKWKLFRLKPAKARQLRTIRRRLLRGDKVRAKLTGKIVDAAGNRYSRTARVVLKHKGSGGKK
jgi:endonuclease/exonuclease/phosphatase family metal-dependent hydrolase